MSYRRRISTAVCIVLSSAAFQASAVAGTTWSAVGGTTTFYFQPDVLAERGLVLEVNGESVTGLVVAKFQFNIASDSTVSFTEVGGYFGDFSGGEMRHIEDLILRSEAGESIVLDSFAFSIANGSDPSDFKPVFEDKLTKQPFLEASTAKAGFDRMAGLFQMETGDIYITPQLAAKLGNASLAGVTIGAVMLQADLVWTGGSPPAQMDEEFPEDDAAPRGGNNGTVCPQPVGPDVILGDISDIGNYGVSEMPPGSGNWIVAFSVGTTSCNIGNALLKWISSTPEHPVIAQNFYRLMTMPNGATRFEQIGQSWLKHGFTALSQNLCGCGCSGGGGSTLGIGCSDPYGASLNGSQSNLGPRWQVDARTGVFPFPYQNGVQEPGGANAWKRLQVKSTDLAPTNAVYFSEGHYVTQDDHQAGNASNNASYRRLTITPGSGNNYTASNAAGSQTIREQPAIRAWKAAVPSVVETDIRISPTAGEPHPNADDLMILAANVKEVAPGQWNYEYALMNLHSHRGARSFTVPVPQAAQLSDVEFRNVRYHSGDGQGGTTRSNDPWTWSHVDSLLTWQTEPFNVNQNANALCWGVLFNFRFTCNIPPASEQGELAIGLFRPGPPNAAISSVNPLSIVPEPAALYISLDASAPTTVLAACRAAAFDVGIENGSDTYSPGTAKLVYSINDGDYLETPLEFVSGTTHRATLQAIDCDSSLKFYISAQTAGGSTVTVPEEAPLVVFQPQVGVEELVNLLAENFESGFPEGWNKTGLWDVTSACPVNPVCDGASWAYYGQPSTCTYQTGTSANSGSLTTELYIPATRLATLSYCSTFRREPFATADWPVVRVNGVVVDQPAQGGRESSPWESRSVDISAYSGQLVTLEWFFNTGDGSNNNYRGWQVDDVSLDVIQVACRAPSPVIAGDINGDGMVDGADLGEFVHALMDASEMPEHVCPGDFDGSGVIDLDDVEGLVAAMLDQP